MTIYTWEPSKRNEIIKRRLEIGLGIPKEAKVIGAWTDLAGGRAFSVIEAADPKVMVAAAVAFNDLIEVETIPVMDSEELIKVAKSQVKV